MIIRPLDPLTDLERVVNFYAAAPDYWLLAEGRQPGPEKARDFFTDGPPGCDPRESYRLGGFLGDRLSGLAELSFGFPEPGDAYLGLMLLGPWAQGKGFGPHFLAHAEGLARARGARHLFLAVLAANPRGRAFWEGQGFAATGVTRQDAETGHLLHRLVKPLDAAGATTSM